eukprot:scaffold133951_cov32-Prasinocladus_malaysianus.AAC.1
MGCKHTNWTPILNCKCKGRAKVTVRAHFFSRMANQAWGYGIHSLRCVLFMTTVPCPMSCGEI